MTRLRGEACGKFILMGEHSVVHGGSAIGFPLRNKKLQVEIDPLIDGVFVNGEKQTHETREHLFELVKILNIPFPRGYGLKVDSEIPIGGGLGSSAALCCALLRATSELSGEDLAKQALMGEHYFHGKSSGVDPYTIALECPMEFQSQEQAYTPLSLEKFQSENLCIGLVDSGHRHITKDVVEAVSLCRENSASQFREIMAQLQSLETQAIVALEKSPEALGPLMNQAQNLLEKLGVSDDGIQDRIKRASRLGAMGAKLTGAGRGGYVICLLEKTQQKSFLEEFSNNNPFIFE